MLFRSTTLTLICAVGVMLTLAILTDLTVGFLGKGLTILVLSALITGIVLYRRKHL